MDVIKTGIWAWLVAALLLGAACAANPVTGEQQLAMMSAQEEIALGERAYPAAIDQYGGALPRDSAMQAYVGRVGRRVAGVSHRPNLPWEFTVVESEEINAFAMPGGKIAITRGLLVRLPDEDSLAFVLAHETGHVTARHFVSRHAQSSLINLGVLGVGVALGGSGWGGVAQRTAGTAGNLVLLSYSRDQERQADDLGSMYMIAAGYNPKAQVEVMELLLKLRDKEPSYVATLFSTHPLDQERLQTARRRVEKVSPEVLARPITPVPGPPKPPSLKPKRPSGYQQQG
ncbi:MAG: M48 family metalloprotease [Desulfarculaceae bacterium]|nr:M48 family metalloprotease [Desulfarculaceae bacterium]MCF8049426.1 M48 family metalloprotease [Desulfarculaceae bacterium]MCF8099970.1 M48 family metalloprotease [Desulfarculaceae bacterium]MCF8124467.1 M48 family metalloprotease [Desulfarculaceae bacterium]